MTHTLYRSGTPESQSEEICWLAYSTKGVNDDNFPETARHLLKAVEDSGDVANWGDTKIGTILTMPAAEIKEKLLQNSRLRGVFSNPRAAVKFLQILKKKKLNQSILLSGVITELRHICKEAGVTPCYANMSLGVFGNTSRLTDAKTLSVTTMCGHQRIPAKYVQALQHDVEQGKITAEEAAKKLGSICMCGVFNPNRAASILANKQQPCSCRDNGNLL
ncbi:hypothetical protein [Escherichia albertii]|uniref:hypothetical protein n=1 Tax=Escherichia albertii TaxID=208962 RepID=UPI0011F34C1C|nr:hypothetical protein [Escherichia albertii]MCB2258339.1 hypothetical protein [Escherichia albertii]MCB2265983.1 hypothetical protein [Escherichia albertii]MCB2271252.1 hypothetical protein [Escherichia albertii]